MGPSHRVHAPRDAGGVALPHSAGRRLADQIWMLLQQRLESRTPARVLHKCATGGGVAEDCGGDDRGSHHKGDGILDVVVVNQKLSFSEMNTIE